jgi:2-polyprenyl-3-methyl-5-hydroxy-6-metoxy-1,4-benzoquinol methylase
MLAESIPLRNGRKLWQANATDYRLPLTKFRKLQAGLYIILRDYCDGRFPPRHDRRDDVHGAELAYATSLPGMSLEDVAVSGMRKPFWFGRNLRKYLDEFAHLVQAFESHGLLPPQRVLELGCGHGWMAEFLAVTGFDVTATTICPGDAQRASRRIESIRAKGLPCKLRFESVPMESVHTLFGGQAFDAVFAFESLHHAYDWRETVRAAYACLKPGGWLFLFNEPNAMHLFISYRVARLSNTHEVGFRPGALKRTCRAAGFRRADIIKNRLHWFVKSISLAAQK